MEKSYVVLASAPSPNLRPSASKNPYKLVCVNGSGWSAKALGLPRPDITVLSGFVLSDKGEAKTTRKALKGLETDRLVLITYGIDEPKAIRKLNKLGYAYEQLVTINRGERSALIRRITGEDLGKGDQSEKISNGIFAVCYALAEGASQVTLSGFSLSPQGGYHYSGEFQESKSAHPRHHLGPDAHALKNLDAKFSLVTTETGLSRETGLRLVSSVD